MSKNMINLHNMEMFASEDNQDIIGFIESKKALQILENINV